MEPGSNLAHITVGVASLKPALEFWTGLLSLELVARRRGADPALDHWWSLPPGSVVDQALVRTPGAATGWLHLVHFRHPGPPVRQDAGATDLGPKNLDVNCHDMPARMVMLKAAGCRFRSGMSEYVVDDIQAREVQVPGHDGTNIVLIEILRGMPQPAMGQAGFAGITSFVVIVPDTEAEARFCREVLGLTEVMHHRITGPGIEAAVGLPPGAALDMRLLGDASDVFGRLELIRYEGLSGINRFPLAVPPATGALHVRCPVGDLAACLDHARRLGSPVCNGGVVETLFGRVALGAVQTPAGLRVEVFQRLG